MRPSASTRTRLHGERLAVVDAAAGGLAHAVRRQHPHRCALGRGQQRGRRWPHRRAAPRRTAAGLPGPGGPAAAGPAGWGPARCSGAGPWRPGQAVAAAKASTVKPAPVSTARGSVPATTERRRTCRPATWWAGMASSHWPGPPSRSWVARADARSAEAVSSARLGVPVEPEVPTTSARPVGEVVGARLRQVGGCAVRGVGDHGRAGAGEGSRQRGTDLQRAGPRRHRAAAAAGGGPPAEDRRRAGDAILSG